MAPDLERMFSSMRLDAYGTRLPEPHALRRRADQRSRPRAVAGLAAAAIVVAGMSIGVHQLIAGGAAPPPPPAGTESPTTSPSPSPSATTAPDGIAAPYPTGSLLPMPAGCDDIMVVPYDELTHAGQPLPASVMLDASDWGRCYAMTGDRPGYPVADSSKGQGSAPDVCGNQEPYAADGERVAGRFRFFRGGPEVGGFESVTLYRSGSAEAFLDEIRARVAQCRTFVPSDMPVDWHAQIVSADFAGDESLLIYIGTGKDGKGYPGWYSAVVRVGDLVIVIEPAVDLGGDREYTTAMARKAAGRIG